MADLLYADRRKTRSTWASEALGHQLREVTGCYSMESLVLADRGGNLWAAAAADPTSVQLARAVARLGTLASGSAFQIAQQSGRSVRVCRLQIGSAALFLAAQGAQRSTEPALAHAAEGVERILASLLA